jgi:hypothetical protein
MKRLGTTLASAMAAALSQSAEIAAAGREVFAEILSGMQRFQREAFLRPDKRRRGISALTASRKRKRSQVGRVRLGRTRGPGSINAKADGLYLARIGQWAKAAEMLNEVAPELAARYRRFADDDSYRMQEERAGVFVP